MKWEAIKKEVIYKDNWKGLEKWKFNIDGKYDKDITIQTSDDFVVVFGVTPDNKVLVIKQYFAAAEKHIYAFVTGMIDDDKSPEQIAESELLEEAGCKADEFVNLGSFFYGKYITGKGYIFLAKGIEKVQDQDLGECEDIECSFVEMDEFKEMLKDGKIKALPEVAAAYRALDYLEKNK